MDKNIDVPTGPGSRLIQQPCTTLTQSFHSLHEVFHFYGYMMQTRTAFGYEARNG